MSIIAIVCSLLHFYFVEFFEILFSREKNIKCTLNTFRLPVNILNVLKKLFKLAMTDLCSFKKKLLELNEREAVKSAWTDQATLYRIHAGIVDVLSSLADLCSLPYTYRRPG